MEKRIKGWSRAKKVTLIESVNPTWRDLAEDFQFDAPAPARDSSPALGM